jgi:hypothetical protein
MNAVVIDGPTRDKLLAAGGEVELRDEFGTVIGKFVRTQPAPPAKRVPGLWKGKVTILSDDDEHLKDFAEYMP